jgi:large subunit ribosomal protein L1
MAMRGKRYRAASEKIDKQTVYTSKDALAKVKELASAKFDESVDVHINLGIDPAKGEHAVRGSVVLPYSPDRKVRVVAFAKGEYVDEAQKAGADYVGLDDLIEKVERGWLDFDYAVATPDVMGAVGKLAKILGPRGLLPNKKLGTVSFEIGNVITDLKKGRLFFKNDKQGLVHFTVGKVSYGIDKLLENFNTFMKILSTSKPPTSKGKFIQKVVVTSTMGPGLQVNVEDVVNA